MVLELRDQRQETVGSGGDRDAEDRGEDERREVRAGAQHRHRVQRRTARPRQAAPATPAGPGRVAVRSCSGHLRGEEVEPEAFGEVLGHQLTADAVAGSVQRRREGGQAALARRHGDDATADATLARHPIS